MTSDMTDNESKSTPKRTSVAKAMIVGILTGFVCGSMFVYATNTQRYGARIKSLADKNTELHNQICEWQSKAHSYESEHALLDDFRNRYGSQYADCILRSCNFPDGTANPLLNMSQTPASPLTPHVAGSSDTIADILAMEPNPVTFTKYWTSDYDNYTYEITYVINKNLYDYYKNQNRSGFSYSSEADCKSVITEAQNAIVLDSIIAQFQVLKQRYDWSDWQLCQEIITFVQTIPYSYDSESKGRSDYPRYPIETLYDGTGDCEDVTFLAASLLKRLDQGIAIIKYERHVCMGWYLRDTPGTYYEVDGRKYYVVECTSKRKIGELASEYVGKQAISVVIV